MNPKGGEPDACRRVASQRLGKSILSRQAGHQLANHICVKPVGHNKNILKFNERLKSHKGILDHSTLSDNLKKLFWGSLAASRPKTRSDPARHDNCKCL